MFPSGMVIERIARPVEGDVAGEFDREVLLGHRHNAASRAMNQGDRTAPITLPRHAPVTQPVDRCSLAAAQRFEPLTGGSFCVRNREPVEEGGIEGSPI